MFMNRLPSSTPRAGTRLLTLGVLSLVFAVVGATSARACYTCNLVPVPWWPYQAWGCDPAYGPGEEGCVSDGWSWCNAYGDACFGNSLPGCFLAGTMVATPDGDRPIEKLEAGDAIWCVDESGQKVLGRVADTIRDTSHGYYQLNGSTSATGAHRFLAINPRNAGAARYEQHALGQWTPLEDISPGDYLNTIDGGTEVVRTIDFVNQGVRVYNLEVQPHHNYFANGHLVHNKKPDPHQN